MSQDAASAVLSQALIDQSSRVSLRALDLEQVPALPPLANCRSLDLGGNRLASLPSNFTQLFPALRELNLDGNLLEHFPTDLPPTLSVLNLRGNQIAGANQYGPHMLELAELNLSNNGMTIFPEWVLSFTNLQVLNLSGNLLADIPKTLAGLTRLRELLVADNFPGIDFGPAVRLLHKLELLDLTNCGLSALPPELGFVSENVIVRLDGNNLDDLPPAVRDAANPTLFAYLRSIEAASSDSEAKLILVGEGNVGKSSLVAALQQRPFLEDRDTTHGIEISLLRRPNPQQAKREIVFRVWDFGGQEVYRITHQFFYSPNAVFILVWRPREGQDDNSIASWLGRIRVRVGSSARVLIVATHGEERRAEIDLPRLRKLYPEMIIGHFVVDSKTGLGLSDLSEQIATTASTLPGYGTKIATTWRNVKQRLVSSDQPYVTFEQYAEICAAYDVKEDQVDGLLQYLHQLGVVVHYADDPSLANLVVLQPDWLSKAIGYVLEDRETANRGGILVHARLPSVWARNGVELYPHRMHPYFLRLMEKFDISYRLASADKSLIGQMVPFSAPDKMDAQIASKGFFMSALVKFSDSPPGLIPWLIARTSRFSIGLHWRSGMVLRNDYGAVARIDLKSPQELELSVAGGDPSYFFHVLRDTLEEMCVLRWPGLSFYEEIRCRNSEVQCTGTFPLRTLLIYRDRDLSEIRCQTCVEGQSVLALLTGHDRRLNTSEHQLVERLERIEKNVLLGKYSAEFAAQGVRATLNALGQEITDCPKLFLITPDSNDWRLWRSNYLLELWCNEPGKEHPVPEIYRFSRSRKWFTTVAPFMRVVAHTMGLLAPAVHGLGELAGQASSDVKASSDFMKAMAVDAASASAEAFGHLEDEDIPTGPAMRAFRTFLFELDPVKQFGGLNGLLTSAGDFLWLCDRHYEVHSPSLPSLPYLEEGDLPI